jgi:hypothetical protein
MIASRRKRVPTRASKVKVRNVNSVRLPGKTATNVGSRFKKSNKY